jgi:photosystem II stability/assembly factor-like uncharacterized protein
MKKTIYLSLLLTVAVAAVYFTSKKVNYEPREISQLEKKFHYDSEAPTGILEAIEYYRLITADPETGEVDPKDYLAAVESANALGDRRLSKPLNWFFRGPDNIGGRTRAFLIDRNNPNLRFAGAVSGGLYRSETGGSSWVSVNAMQENLNVSCITQTKNGEIYYGTGENGFLSSFQTQGDKQGTPGFAGAGIFKSTDGGQTFTQLPTTVGFNYVSWLAADSLKSNRLWAGTPGGLRYSDDGGVTWTTKVPGNCRDIHVASNGTILIYHGANSISRSTDGGENFTSANITYTNNNLSRLRIAASVQDPNYVYVVTVNSGSQNLEGIYRSKDNGANFEKIQNGNSTLFNPLSQVLTTQGQGNYDLAITVDPTNKDRVIVAGVQMGEWIDGKGAKIIASLADFPQNTAYVHADKHEFTWDNSTNPPTLIVSTDGGMYYSSDLAVTFTERNKNYTTTQFYGMAANKLGHVVGGTQDNGTLLVNGVGNSKQFAYKVLGGDGFQCEYSRIYPNIVFGESQYGNLRRSINNGGSFAPIWDSRIQPEVTSLGNSFADFNAQFKLWENEMDSSSRLFFCGTNRIWMAVDAINQSELPTWFNLADNTNGLGGGRILDIEYTPDGGTLFVSKGVTLYRIDGINLATWDTTALPGATQQSPFVTVSNISLGLPGNRAVTSINLDPNDPNRALITLGNYGQTNYVYLCNNILDPVPVYTNVTGNLPKMPVYDAIISERDPNMFILATDLGMWATENGGTTYTEQNNGLARVPTYIIRQYVWNNWEGPRIYTATHGRGFFETQTLLTNLPEPRKPSNVQNLTIYPNPASVNTNIRFNLLTAEKNAQINIIDISGKIVKTQNISDLVVGENNFKLNLDGLKQGNYIVSLKGTTIQSSGRISVIR